MHPVVASIRLQSDPKTKGLCDKGLAFGEGGRGTFSTAGLITSVCVPSKLMMSEFKDSRDFHMGEIPDRSSFRGALSVPAQMDQL